MRAIVTGWWRWVAVVSLAWCGAAVGQMDGFVGVPWQVGGFESSDPVLTGEVMTGLIPTGQDRFLFGTSDRGGISGWIDGGPWAAYNDGVSKQQTMLGFDKIQRF